MWIHLRARPADARHDRLRHVVHRLLWSETRNGVAEVALHGVAELGLGGDREDSGDMDVRTGELGAERFSESGLRGFRGAVAAHLGDAALPDDRRDEK